MGDTGTHGPTGGLAARPAGKVHLSRVAGKLFERARLALAHGDIDAAERMLESVLALAPGNAEVVRTRGLVAEQRGDVAKVIECYGQVVHAWPTDAGLHLTLGAALFAAGSPEDGISHLRRACDLDPCSASAWLNLGEALKQVARGREAIDALRRARGLDPDSTAIQLALARACASAGEGAAAAQALHGILRREPANPRAWFGLSSLNTYRFSPTETQQLRNCVANAVPGSQSHELLGFALGKALEDQGDYAAAFERFRAVNGLRHARGRWNAAAEHQRMEAIRRTFEDWQSPRAGASGTGREVIFIASIPRSGSSLVEQILASHPEVEGANEVQVLPDLVDHESVRRQSAFPLWAPHATCGDWQRLGAEYLQRTARWRVRRPRSTDKNLATWYLVGAALAMLPAAHVVVVRRNPVETCLACYRQRLEGDAGFSCDLDDMADYCIDFIQLTRFWLRRFPGRVFDLEYETLLASPETTVRQLLAFCGLAFDPACMDSHQTDRSVLSAPSALQVRQPLRRDTARAARYGAKLDRLRTRLRAANLPV